MGFIKNAIYLTLVCQLTTSCGDAEILLERILGKAPGIDHDEYVPVPGSPASDFLSKTFADETVGTTNQLAAMNVAIDDQAQMNLTAAGLLLTTDQTTIDVASETYDVLKGAEKNKRALDSSTYQKLDGAFFEKTALLGTDYTNDTVDWGSHSDTSFTIAALDRMPVRDQGRRGTCASFAGIGLIEALIIQANAASIPFKEIDLSEQRFYYLSKPESWANGGSTSAQGSDSGTGFTVSNGAITMYPAPTDTSGSSYNIPLEIDCPYNKQLGSNDLQTPLPDKCKTKGIVKVKQFTSWAGSQGTANVIQRAQSIYNELRSNKAVVAYTKLSGNWERNDGLITYAAAGAPGGTSHASGHAYLIVGAKKLDEAKFPNEGGMCFIIRNSWGTGWGAKGLSCMTLKWFNYWRLDTDFPTVDAVELTTGASGAITIASNRPSGIPEPDPNSRTNSRGGRTAKRKGSVVISFLPGSSPWMPQNYSDSTLREVNLSALTADDMKFGKIVADNDQTYKMLYLATSDTLVVRGILSGDAAQTHSLELKRSGSSVIYDVEGRGDVVVGEFSETAGTDGSAATAVICGKKYASVCDLHYMASSNELVIGLSEIEASRQLSAPPYNWQGISIAGYGLELSRPSGSLTTFDVRVAGTSKSTAGNPIRLKLNPKNGDIFHQSNNVGNLTELSLCSGRFRTACRVVSSAGNLDIFSKKAAP
jgi:C1A family cysteine protease